MKKHRRRPAGISLIERALIERDWHSTAVSAQIHALYGDSSHGMVNAAGRVLYVILGAAITDGLDHEHPDIRIVRGAVNAVHDQVGEEEIPAARRASIVSGLEASERLIPLLQRRSLITAACDLKQKMKTSHVHLSDFHALIEGATA
jgi:hypothetical protein